MIIMRETRGITVTNNQKGRCKIKLI